MQEDRKSTRLNSSHTEIYTLSLHDALPISYQKRIRSCHKWLRRHGHSLTRREVLRGLRRERDAGRSEEHTSELQSHRDLHSFPTRRSSDLLPETYPVLPQVAKAARPLPHAEGGAPRPETGKRCR